jgi:hypothetical protein
VQAANLVLIRIEAIVCMSWVRKAPGQFVIQVKYGVWI